MVRGMMLVPRLCLSLYPRHSGLRMMSTYIRAAAVNNHLINASENKRPTVKSLPNSAKVVICGGEN